jgi:hypothetical protein
MILAAVIDHQQLKVGKSLRQYRSDGRRHETLSIEDGHNDTDARLRGFGHL